jgi:hypothetical protein
VAQQRFFRFAQTFKKGIYERKMNIAIILKFNPKDRRKETIWKP